MSAADVTVNVNGNYVTRAELSANLTPIKSDVSEIKADVKILLAGAAGDRAVSGSRKYWLATGAVLLGSIWPVVIVIAGH